MSAPVDISRIKPGDEVLVRCVVKELHDNLKWPVVVDLHPVTEALALVQPGKPLDGQAFVFAEAIASHTPKALAAEDTIRRIGGAQTGRVLATYGREAWILFHSEPVVMLLSDLERAQ